MQQINSVKPDIKISSKGIIELYSGAVKRLGLEEERNISFFIDDDKNMYIRKDSDGLSPSAIIGKNHLRFYSIAVVRTIRNLPDVNSKSKTLLFRIGETEDNIHYPIITRKPL